MHNLQTRANFVFSIALSAIGWTLATVAILTWLTGYGTPSSSIRVDSNTLRVVSRRYGPDHYDYGNAKNDFGRFSFDIDADLTPLFNWNTKQVFLSVVAEYETETHNHNSIVVWDKIVTRADPSHVFLRNVPIKYALIDVSRKWSHQQANLSLHWDITPYVGILQGGRSSSSLADIILAPVSKQK